MNFTQPHQRPSQRFTSLVVLMGWIGSAVYARAAGHGIGQMPSPLSPPLAQIYPVDPYPLRICLDPLFVANEAIITSTRPSLAQDIVTQALIDSLSWPYVQLSTRCKVETIDGIPRLEQAEYYINPILHSWIEQPDGDDIHIQAVLDIHLWKVREKQAHLINSLHLQVPDLSDRWNFWLEDVFPHTSEGIEPQEEQQESNALQRYRVEQMAYRLAETASTWLQQHHPLQPRELAFVAQEQPDRFTIHTPNPLPWYVDDWINLYPPDLSFPIERQRITHTDILELVTLLEDPNQPLAIDQESPPKEKTQIVYRTLLRRSGQDPSSRLYGAQRLEKMGFELGLGLDLEPMKLSSPTTLATNHRLINYAWGIPALKGIMAFNLMGLNLGDTLLALQASYTTPAPLQSILWAAGLEKRWWLHHVGLQWGLAYTGNVLLVPTLRQLVELNPTSNTITHAWALRHGIQSELGFLWSLTPYFLWEIGGGYRWFPQTIPSFTGKDRDVSLGEHNGRSRTIDRSGWLAHIRFRWLW